MWRLKGQTFFAEHFFGKVHYHFLIYVFIKKYSNTLFIFN
tara:strand:+ start:1096 stop:1215 length:120 start_codon:yes stop_codon:yes gene_type:complete